MKSLRHWLLERLVKRRPELALRLAAQAMGVHSARIPVPQHSPLYAPEGGEAIEMPLDDVISPYVMRHAAWQEAELKFLRDHAPAGACVLVDLGANVGLVTRQLMHALPQITHAVCFEPHPLNHLMLSRNLAHLPAAHCIRAALGPQAGSLKFYEDLANAGNYSLAEDSVRGRPHRTSTVSCLAASEEALLSALPPSARTLPVLYKSDIQGLDEIVATALPASFWGRVHAGVMELSRIERPAFDPRALTTMLAKFPVLRFGTRPEQNLRMEDVLAHCQGTDGRHEDLYFARA